MRPQKNQKKLIEIFRKRFCIFWKLKTIFKPIKIKLIRPKLQKIEISKIKFWKNNHQKEKNKRKFQQKEWYFLDFK